MAMLPETVQIMGYNANRFNIKDLIQMFQDMDCAGKILLSELLLILYLPLVYKKIVVP